LLLVAKTSTLILARDTLYTALVRVELVSTLAALLSTTASL
jgi:hypothetical protein